MFCKKCGTQLKENAKFCASCGTSVVIEQQDAPVKPVQPQVAADPFAQPVQPQAAADPFVQPVQPQVAPQPQQWGPMMQPTKEKKHGKAPLVIGLSIAALVVVLAVVIILLFACGGGGAASAQEAAEAYFEALNEEDFDASGNGMLVGETYDELEAVEEATANNLAMLIIQRYRGCDNDA